MVKLFLIKCSVRDIVGYVADETILKHDGFNVKYIKEEDVHHKDSSVVLFFSRGKATVIRDKIMELALNHKPGHKASIEVVSDFFEQDVADTLMAKDWTFTYEKDDD